MDYNLRPIWNAILGVWKECYAICRRHNLRVWVGYGTAIGALRHKGFIPWDDDFDVMMPRYDYNLFMKYAVNELPSYMKWHSIDNDPEYGLLFGKVQDERLDIINSVKKESHLALTQGIFVDFFPLDGLPSSKAACFWWYIKRSIIRRLNLFGGDCLRMQDWLANMDFDHSTKVAWLLSDIGYPRCIFKREWFMETELVDFESLKVPLPNGVRHILNNLYGDYMKMPPIEKRVPSHQLLQ